MSGFTSIPHYAPWLVLLVGAFTIGGALGIGNCVGRALRLHQPWLSVVGSVCAIELLALAVEVVAIARIATPAMLIALWVAFAAAGTILLFVRAGGPFRPDVPSLGSVGAAAILLINLLIAICPSTKADELYYHMLVPSRIVLDSGLKFYRLPLLSAVYPQMAFQIGFAPFHALGIPDAGNVVSWFFGVLLVWFAYRLVKARTASSRWAGMFAAALVAGLYTSVWHVTSGAHAIGDLATAAAVVALYVIDDLIAMAGPARAGVAVGVLAAAAASSKVLLFPFAAAVVLVALTTISRRSSGSGERPRVLAGTALPGLLFMGPLAIWTAVHSGSPLGPLLQGFAGRSPYSRFEVHDFVADYVAGPRGPILQKLANEALNYSPVVWLAGAAFLFCGRRIVRTRPWLALAFVLVQVVVILGWNTYDARYLGGVHYALMILFALFVTPEIRDRALKGRGLTTAMTVLVIPWMVLQAGYSGGFLKLIARFESTPEFYAEHVAFFRDFKALDSILPPDAAILSMPYGLDSFYVPRPIYYDPRDLPLRGPTYLLTFQPGTRSASPPRLDGGFTLEEQVYENSDAVVSTYRIPGRRPRLGIARVWRLRRAEEPR